MMQGEQPQAGNRPDDILTPKEVAREYRLSEQTLANWRAQRQGPKYIRIGDRAVRYRRADIGAFIANCTDEGRAA